MYVLLRLEIGADIEKRREGESSEAEAVEKMDL